MPHTETIDEHVVSHKPISCKFLHASHRSAARIHPTQTGKAICREYGGAIFYVSEERAQAAIVEMM